MDLHQLSTALQVLASIDPGALPLHHAQALVEIGLRGSASYAEIGEALNLSHASVSRTVNSLANPRHRRHGHGLIEITIDPDAGRRYLCKPSRKGKALLAAIQAINNPTNPNHGKHQAA